MIKNPYELIGTNRDAIERDLQGNSRTEQEKDQFILEKYEHTIRMLDIKLGIPNLTDAARKVIEMQKQEVTKSFDLIKNTVGREMFDKNLSERMLNKEQNGKVPFRKELNAYELLGTNRLACEVYRTPQEVDRYLEYWYQRMITKIEESLQSPNANFKTKQRDELYKKRLEEAYEKIRTEERRKKYNAELDELKAKRLEEKRQARLKVLYDYSDEYSRESILKIGRKDIDGNEWILQRRNGEKIKIQQTGRIGFVYEIPVFSDYVEEYQVTRYVNGKEQTDTIYGDITLIELSVNSETRKLYNPNYYQCVVNNLLSDDSIDMALKFNKGYIGSVIQNKDGSYQTTFGHGAPILKSDKRALSATMKYKEIRDRSLAVPEGPEQE